MISRPAQYLLRFDDLCPTYAHERWERFVPLIAEFAVRPILAIVPDNRDPELDVSASDPEFWAKMRALEAAGSTIGLHGYRHLCVNRGRSLVPLHRESEFAGVPEPIQRQWIREGLGILRAHRLNPRIWVAPRHGFDRATLRALHEEGIRLLSDGYAQRPFLRGGLVWIPQQLWAPVVKPGGLWTICLHANTMADAQIAQLREFLLHHASELTSVERVVDEFDPTPLSVDERLASAAAILRVRVRGAAKTLFP